jgi:hypothetical protein
VFYDSIFITHDILTRYSNCCIARANIAVMKKNLMMYQMMISMTPMTLSLMMLNWLVIQTFVSHIWINIFFFFWIFSCLSSVLLKSDSSNDLSLSFMLCINQFSLYSTFVNALCLQVGGSYSLLSHSDMTLWPDKL